MLYKYCTACKGLKTTDNFHKSKQSPDGYVYECKDCKKTRFKNNKEAL